LDTVVAIAAMTADVAPVDAAVASCVAALTLPVPAIVYMAILDPLKKSGCCWVMLPGLRIQDWPSACKRRTRTPIDRERVLPAPYRAKTVSSYTLEPQRTAWRAACQVGLCGASQEGVKKFDMPC
jgi:hypothetical protein